MSGYIALRIAYKNPNQFPVVCGISPAIDFQKRWEEGDTVLRAMYPDKEAARQETALLYVRPLDYPRHQFFCCDPADTDWWEGVDRLQMKLASLGVPFESDLETTAGGHGFEYYTHMAPRVAEFVAEKLEFERRRLV